MPASIHGKVQDDIVISISQAIGRLPESHSWASQGNEQTTDCVQWSLSGRPRTDPRVPEDILVDIELLRSNNIDDVLSGVRQLIKGSELIAYKSIDWWLGVYETVADHIVVCPSADQFDILRFEMGPSPWSDSEYFIDELKEYDDHIGIDITGAGYAVVEFRLKRVPTGEEAQALSDRILEFAPDVVYGGGEVVEVIDFAKSDGLVSLWWD